MRQQWGKLARLLVQHAGSCHGWQQQAMLECQRAAVGQLTDAAGRAPWCLQLTAAYRATIENQGKSSKAKAKATARANDSLPASPAGQPDDRQAATGGTAISLKTSDNPLPAGTTKQSMLRVSCPSNQLTTDHIGNYYALQPKLLPEAFAALHHTFLAPRTSTEHSRSGGCSGLQKEQQAVSLTVPTTMPLLMHRQVMEGLWQLLQRGVVASAGGDAAGLPARLLLRGPTGCGKSCTMAALVERARANGWLCLYIPSAVALTKGGLFVAHPASIESKTGQQWDTPIAAQHILLGMQQAHGPQLAKLSVQLDSTLQLLQAAAGANSASAPNEGKSQRSLAQLVTHGLAADDAHTPVDVVLALIAELSAAASPDQPVLLAVDDYNALYGQTGYGKHVRTEDEQTGATRVQRVPLQVEELRLANAMRLLQQPASHLRPAVQVVAAMSHTGSLSTLSHVPVNSDFEPARTEIHVPRYSKVEVAHALYHYYECGVSAQAPGSKSVNRLLLLTHGNAAELRQLAAMSPLLEKTTMPTVVL